MIVAGTLVNKMAPALRKVYDQMSEPNGSFQWAHALMAVDITTTLIRSRADAIELFR